MWYRCTLNGGEIHPPNITISFDLMLVHFLLKQEVTVTAGLVGALTDSHDNQYY